MGAYVSTAVTEKFSEDGRKHDNTIKFGASSMQGWRISQEDGHSCLPDFDEEKNISLFAVYDGHGGAEVAQYAAQKFPECLKENKLYNLDHDLTNCLKASFIEFDKSLTKPEIIQHLKEIAGVPEEEEEIDEDEKMDIEQLKEEADMPLSEVLSKYEDCGAVLKELKKKTNFQSPMLLAKKESKLSLSDRNGDAGEVSTDLRLKLMNGQCENENNSNAERERNQQDTQVEGGEKGEVKSTGDQCPLGKEKVCRTEVDTNGGSKVDGCGEPVNAEGLNTSSNASDIKNSDALSSSSGGPSPSSGGPSSSSDGPSSSSGGPSSSSGGPSPISGGLSSSSGGPSSSSGGPSSSSDGPSTTMAGPSSSSDGPSTTMAGPSSSSDGPSTTMAGPSSSSDGPSTTMAGPSSSSDCPSSSSDGPSSSTDGPSSSSDGPSSSSDGPSSSSDGPSSITKSSLSTAGSSGISTDALASSGDDSDNDDSDSDELGWEDCSSEDDEENDSDSEDDVELEEGQDQGNIMGAGEEPGHDSGCTAVVVLLKDDTLYVANAGDSRCIICRGGKAIDLSIDHKPENPEELKRITAAGGKVTLDGRVNGGLNLSRAFGDHCYKTNPEKDLTEQMITALPDVTALKITPEDSFFVLACDGIWNVMMSQEVVDFVKAKLDEGTEPISKICEEMFNHCLAPDTIGDGTGCDNMTCVIVKLCPKGDMIENGNKRPRSPGCDEECEIKRSKES